MLINVSKEINHNMGKIVKAIQIPIFFLIIWMAIYIFLLTQYSNLSYIFLFIVPFSTIYLGKLEVDLVKGSRYKENIAFLMFAFGGLLGAYSLIIDFGLSVDPNVGLIIPVIGVIYGSNKFFLAFAYACTSFFRYHLVGRS